MSLIWSRRSQANLKSILKRIAEDDPVAAAGLVEKIVGSAEATLDENTMAGRSGRIEGTREWVAHKRYIVVYRIKENQVQVITVRHTSPSWPRRL
jgi:toxin ParE1/3/4